MREIKLIRTPKPIGNFVNVRFSNNLAYLSGQGAFNEKNELITGKVGKEFNLEQAYQIARLVGISLISVMKNDIGLDKISKIIKILGFVNCTEDFTQQPQVINGCSDLFIEFFGEKGMHARSALGVYVLPNNIPVEIETIIEIKN